MFGFSVFQILGSVVLGVGIWVAADKSSFIALLVENEQVWVSEMGHHQALLDHIQ